MSLISRLIYARRSRVLGRLAKELLALYGVEVPRRVEVGPGLRVMHRGFGTVIHPSTSIGANVTLYHGVTIGRGDPWLPPQQSGMDRVEIEDDVVLCPGAKVICRAGTLTVACGTVVGANAVLLQSTGPGEVWAGVPARLVGKR